MQRIWMKRVEIDGIFDLFRRELKAETNLISFGRVLPLLSNPEPTRLIWSRTAKQEFERWGVKVGIRHHKQAFVVRIVDPERWKQAITEPAYIEPPIIPDRHPDDDDNAYLIPKHDPFFVMPEFGADLQSSIESGQKVLITGPTGCGKTSVVRELAARMGKKFMRVNLNGETSVSDVIGGWRVRGRDMHFQYGPVPTAMRIGAWLTLDELDAATPQILFALQPVLEENGELFIPDTGETIIPHPDFRVIASANTIGKGDDSGLYCGVNTQNESQLDRYQCVFQASYLPAQAEVDLLLRKYRGLELQTAKRMVKVAGDLRNALQEGVLYSTFSTRKLLAWAKVAVQLANPKRAAVYTILNKLSPDDARIVAEVLQRHGF